MHDNLQGFLRARSIALSDTVHTSVAIDFQNNDAVVAHELKPPSCSTGFLQFFGAVSFTKPKGPHFAIASLHAHAPFFEVFLAPGGTDNLKKTHDPCCAWLVISQSAGAKVKAMSEKYPLCKPSCSVSTVDVDVGITPDTGLVMDRATCESLVDAEYLRVMSQFEQDLNDFNERKATHDASRKDPKQNNKEVH